MSKLTITAKGQVTLNKDVLAHLNLRPGETVEVEKLPGGEVRLKSTRKRRPISDSFGMLKAPEGVSISIEEMDEIIADAWAGKR